MTDDWWRPIAGAPGYDVSRGGQVRTWRVRGRGRTAVLADEPTLLSVYKYGRVVLHIGGVPRVRNIRRLVARAFEMPPGPTKARRKLDEEKARDIERRRNAGEKSVVLEHEYDVSRSVVWAVATGRAWKRTG